MSDEKAPFEIDMGPCCVCEQSTAGNDAPTITMLDYKAPAGFQGWGCSVCKLPTEGAVAVLCQSCAQKGAAGEPFDIKFICGGTYARERQRVSLEGYARVPHDHDARYHPETWTDEDREKYKDLPIPTRYRVYRADAPPKAFEVQWIAEPGFETIKALVLPLIGGAHMEHVNVWFEEKYRDMFVDEDGIGKGLPVNKEATEIYRANWLKQHPDADPRRLPDIRGTAVLFERKVWT